MIGLEPCCEECVFYEAWRIYVGDSPHGGLRSCARCLTRPDEELWDWRDDHECPKFEWRPER